ncbi:MauE/DoxX family redox-associated membrane protein [Streptomyces sp. NPDC001404]|uniref:MauE/DoxX family redox-associated membrane protein n=1 Tax=Streptomyces sp. NPDC001404 TaxID=3364571 RepID=UPI00369B7501
MIALTCIRVALGAVLTMSGLGKAAGGLAAARKAISAYRLLPQFVIPAVVYGLPPLEVASGIALLSGIITRAAAVVSGAVLLAGTCGMVAVLTRADRVSCGCFGPYFEQVVSWKTVTRNVVLMAFSVAVSAWGGGLGTINDAAPQGMTEWLLLGLVVTTGIAIPVGISLHVEPVRAARRER